MKKLFLLPVMMFALVGCNKPAPAGPVCKLDFSSVTETTGKSYESAEAATTAFASYKVEGQAVTVTEVTNVYEGGGTGGAKENAAGLLKLGKGKGNGVLKFTAASDVTKVILNCHSFYASSEQYPTNTTNAIKVNGSDAVALPYNATGAGENLEFTITASKEITIETCHPTDATKFGRAYIYTITLQ